MTEEVPVLEEYKFGFHDNAELVMSTGTGLTEDVIRTMSAAKKNQNGCWISASSPSKPSKIRSPRMGA